MKKTENNDIATGQNSEATNDSGQPSIVTNKRGISNPYANE